MDDPLASGRTFDWALCCLCQAKSRKDLRHPYKKECHHPAYDALENDIKTFTENSIPLPLGLSLADLDDGTGIASTLLNNQAKYHNACRSRFRPLMVQRELEKRTRDSDEKATPSPKKTALASMLPWTELLGSACAVRGMKSPKSCTELGVPTVAETYTSGQLSQRTGLLLPVLPLR